MNNLRKILIAALMMPLCMVAGSGNPLNIDKDEQNGDDADKSYLLAEVPGINSDMRPQIVESDFDLTGERLTGIRGPREGAEVSTPWDVLRRGIQYLPEDVKLRALQHFEQIDHKGYATIDDAVALANHYRYGATRSKNGFAHLMHY